MVFEALQNVEKGIQSFLDLLGWDCLIEEDLGLKNSTEKEFPNAQYYHDENRIEDSREELIVSVGAEEGIYMNQVINIPLEECEIIQNVDTLKKKLQRYKEQNKHLDQAYFAMVQANQMLR